MVCAIRSLAYICILCVLESVHVKVVMYLLGFPWLVYLSMFGMDFFSRRVTSTVSFCFSIPVVIFCVSLIKISDQIE